MASIDSAERGGFFPEDAWSWWQARRLQYNLTLAAAGWLAYFAAVGLNYAFGHPLWHDWRSALGATLFLGTGYLVVMGAANVCYLLGPAVEAWVAPPDVDGYRRTAYAMGRWGSLLVPAAFPLVQLAVLIANP
jgi:hypothetical protein